MPKEPGKRGSGHAWIEEGFSYGTCLCWSRSFILAFSINSSFPAIRPSSLFSHYSKWWIKIIKYLCYVHLSHLTGSYSRVGPVYSAFFIRSRILIVLPRPECSCSCVPHFSAEPVLSHLLTLLVPLPGRSLCLPLITPLPDLKISSSFFRSQLSHRFP